MAGWLKKAEDYAMGGPNGPGGMPPMAPAVKPPMSEKEDVATADSVIKALKGLIASEKAQGGTDNKKDVKTLEDALKKVEDFAEAEKKQKKEQEEEAKKEKEKMDKEREKAEKEMKKNEPKGE